MTYPMKPYRLHRPESVEAAVALAAEHPGAKYLAGGTDLVVNMRRRIAEPGHAIDLGAIAELRGIRRAGEHIEIGAGTTIAEIAQHPEVCGAIPILAEAAGRVAGPTIRSMATLGGNLVLDTRCIYYNQSYFWRQANDFCLKKEGTVCHVAPGGSFCWAAFSADTPPALLVLGAAVEIVGAAGPRTVPLAEFYGTDGRWSIGEATGGRRPGELLLRARVGLLSGEAGAAEGDVRVALFDGVHPAEESGRPQLLAATDEECGYAWGIAEGRHFLGEALLLQAAQVLGREVRQQAFVSKHVEGPAYPLWLRLLRHELRSAA
ncbi:MAG: FAD binding domain-containing protein [SAR324 cluster bacterium]|nr:FAD binding domain-containing protein [SAR324 cluster bacterium]